jgi:hypothetical protein
MKTRSQRMLEDVRVSLGEALTLANRSDSLGAEDIQRIRTAANQAAQASAELNQLVGHIEANIFKD